MPKAREERLLAERRLLKSEWWTQLHVRFFSACLTPKRGASAGLANVWIAYSKFFRAHGYWFSDAEFQRQLKLAGYFCLGPRIRDVKFKPAFDLLCGKLSGHWSPRELELASGIHGRLLATLRESGDGPPFRKLGRSVLYDKAGYRRWLKAGGGDIANLVQRFASARLKFESEVDPLNRQELQFWQDGRFIAAAALRQALVEWCAVEDIGGIPPGAWESLRALLKGKGCVSSRWYDEVRRKVGIWRGAWFVTA